MKFTYYGHSCFMVETQGKQLLFDPFISPNELAKDVDIDAIKPDFIILSHGHGDHVADVARIYGNSEATIISTYEVVGWFQAQGLERGHPMNHGGSWTFDFGKIKLVNAVHSSSMPDGSYGGHPAGVVIQNDEGTFYYAGDTALTKDMELIGEEFDLTFAVLPVGDNFTMGMADAMKATDMINCKEIVGVHFDTFPYVAIDHSDAQALAADAGVNLTLPKIGEEISF